ncbi:ABC-2 family transporter protein [bacterium BMS3Abin02]|nr:ABC-2 family transporter protein [bacterium BMS3Abin02]
MTVTTRLTGRYLAEYARRPINLVLLVLVPLIFVILTAGTIADFAEALGFAGDPSNLVAPTAGWAAAFIAGVAGFFHVLGSRDADRRLAAAGMGARRIVAGRLASGLALALLAAGASIAALALRTGLTNPGRTIAGVVMFSILYLGIGVAIGSLVRSDINGSLIVIFIWMFDVFLGPAMSDSDIWITRLFPSHFITLVMLDTPSGHSGSIGNLGWALLWTFGALGVAAAVFIAATSTRGIRRAAGPVRASWNRLRAGFRFGQRDYRRNVAMWVLLIVLPVLFISLSFYVTPGDPTPVELTENGIKVVKTLSLADVHGAIMVPITLAFLAGLSGLFVVQGSLEADSRLAIAGFRPREILSSRLGTIVVAALLATAVALGVTALDFTPKDWGWFAVGSGLIAITYGMIGVLVGVLFGRLGGLYVMFLVPFIDVGMAQNIMFSAAPPSWGLVLPGRGASQVIVDAAFTTTFDQLGALLLGLAWLVVLAAVTATVFQRIAKPKRA